MRLLSACLVCLLWASSAAAQHPCDLTYATSGTGGPNVILEFCHSGTLQVNAQTVNVEAWRLYMDGNFISSLIPTTNNVVNSTGLKNWIVNFAAQQGQHTYTVKGFHSGAGESPASNPFVYVVVVPPVWVAPSKLRIH